MKHFHKEVYLLQQAIEDDYNQYLKTLIPEGLLPIQKLCLMVKQVDALALRVLSDSSDHALMEARIRLNIARRTMMFYLGEL